ncbi:hypothetical protein [Streptomyces cavernae]|uniref:hypothetical protein n=1 Tax=Streptomyces cavernae TaxID=2259034 RepID=UPI000FEC1B6F|nr:hypothetical protein [Streptomyces cavernae]
MRTRKAITAAMAALAITLAGCGSSDANDANVKATESSTPVVENGPAETAANLPDEPDAGKTMVILRALQEINPALIADQDKAIDNARNQCSVISGGGDADAAAQARFSTSDHQVSDAEAKAINAALKETLCP